MLRIRTTYRYVIAWFVCLSAMINHLDAQERVADVLNDRTLDLKRPGDREKAVVKMKIIEERRLKNAHAKGRALGIPLFENLPNGGWRELVDFDAEGPVFRESRNYNAAVSTGANLTWTSPYALNGSGLIVGVWDGGLGRTTHREFTTGSRLVAIDTGSVSAHATHVIGTIGAFGVNPGARGMANAVKIHSYTAGNDKTEMTGAGATAAGQTATKVYTSNHSYGPNDGWNGSTWGGTGTDQNAYDVGFGQYNSSSRDVDSLIYNTPYLASFWACGNDGSDNPTSGNTVTINGQSVTYNPAIHPAGDGLYRGGYETINAESIGKNIIAIGAVDDAVTAGVRDPSKGTKASLSSTGPTDDGRIKPDLVANGVSVLSTGMDSDSHYYSTQGTSMATPNACGSATLLVDQYNRLFSSAMRASTLKALLIHTADDIGRPGPDYFYGWGLINVKKGADLIASHAAYPAAQQIVESHVSTTTTTREYSFVWDGSSPIAATMAWTDPAANEVTTHDSRTPVLVNNLNLKIIAPNGTEYFPYTMPFVGTWTVASMSQNATTGINNVDNVEQVRIASPGQTGTWRAVISYTGSITNTTQNFGLIISGLAPVPTGIALTSPNGGESLTAGTSKTITWSSVIGGNVSIELLKNGALSSTISTSTPNNGSYTWAIPAGQTLGNDYRIRISSISDPAKISTSATNFSIIAPLTMADALDTTGLTWSNAGNSNWIPQSTFSHDNVDAARSGAITHSQTSTMQTTVTGPGTLTFWWKVSSESNFDFLELYLNTTLQTGANARISGDVDWVQRTLSIPTGSQTVKWTYKKDSSDSVGMDMAWVDEVVYIPTGSLVVSYAGNGNTGGAVPVDGNAYANGATVTVLGNTGSLVRTGYTFAGWNTASNGSGTAYTAGNTFTINANTTLYAQWAGAATYTVSYDGNGNNGGTAPSNQTKTQGIALTLATNSGNLTKTGFGFSGWNTLANGNGTSYAAGASYNVDSDQLLYAKWNAVPVVHAGPVQTVYLTQSTPWSPSALTPQLWLDADDTNTNTLTLNGSTVSQWNDKSGNLRHATATGTAEPTATAASLNGKRVITFDGTSDVLSVNLDFLANVSHSAFIVTKPTAFNNIYGAANGSAGANSLHVGFNANNYRMNYWSNDYGPARTANFVAGSANLMNYVWTSGTGKQIFANGKSEGTNASAGVIGTMSGGGRIGSAVGQGYFGGDIAELIMITGNVSATDREKMEGYLAHKWGLVGNLPSGHTYIASPPGGSGPAAIANLDGTVTDADTLTTTWSVVSGPASVSFGNANTIDTTATFTVAGTYTLRLTANDGFSQVSDDVVITVSNPTPYLTWTGGTFANNFTNTSSTQNPDNDNLTNLQEFAFGTDPTLSNFAALTYVSNGTANPGIPILENTGTPQSPVYRAVFARRKNHATAGITYEVQFSANLQYWKASSTGMTVLSGTSTTDVEAVSVPFPTTVPLSTAETQFAAPKFFRVAVSEN